MSVAKKIIKPDQGLPTPVKHVKSLKKETSKQIDHKLQPTPEQMRIAVLINTKKEDPKLKEKIRQVMDATQRTAEEAYIALHDSEFDPNRAVNLLLEVDVDSEWSTSSKKKKAKPIGEKPVKSKAETAQDVTSEETGDTTLYSKPSIGNRSANWRGRGGKTFFGRSSNFQQPDVGNKGRTVSRHSTNNTDNSNEDVIETWTFERATPPTIRPVDTWDPKRPISSLLNQARSDDCEEEEYTGPLTTTLVYTSSGGNTLQYGGPTVLHSSNIPESEVNAKGLHDITHKNLLSNTSTKREEIQPIATASNIQVEATDMQEKAPLSSPLKVRSPPIGANITKLPPRNDKAVKEDQEVTINKVPPKSAEMAKGATKPVEMPPNSVQNSIGLLDLQFGSMELKSKPSECSVSASAAKTQNLNENRSSHLPPSTKSPTSNIFQGTTNNPEGLVKEPVCPTPDGPKPVQAYSSSYLSGLAACSNSTPNCQSTYASSTGIITGATSTSCNYVTKSQAMPMLPNLTNTYQNILGNQSFGSNSQSMYSTNPSPTSSCTAPYQTYSSAAQQSHKPTLLPIPFTSSKDFETGNHNFGSRSSVPNTGSMLSGNHVFSSTKATTLPKNPILPNIPPLMGHQYIIGQGGIPYFQHPIYYQDLQMMQQQRLASPMNTYYDLGYASVAREGIPGDRIFSKPDTNTGMIHTNQVIGGCVAPHMEVSSEVFGSKTDNYRSCEGGSVACNDNPEQNHCQLITPSINTTSAEITSKSHSSQSKMNHYN